MPTPKPPALPDFERTVTVAVRHRGVKVPRGSIERMIATLDADGRWEVPEGELSVVFVTDPELAQLHEQFLDDPTLTDVITFEGDPLCGSAGEVCLSVDRALAVAAELKTDPVRELTLYLVHGYLHLAGFDDLQPAKKRVMRRAEVAALKALETAGTLPAFALSKSKPERKRAVRPRAAKTPASKRSARGARSPARP